MVTHTSLHDGPRSSIEPFTLDSGEMVDMVVSACV